MFCFTYLVSDDKNNSIGTNLTNKMYSSSYSIIKSDFLYPTNNLNIKEYSSPFTTKCKITLRSRLFLNVLNEDLLMGIRTELKVLLLSPFDSIQGIPVESNQPLGCTEPLINLTRPAVLRIYYGVSKVCTKSLNIVRPTYGPISTSSSVGMDPHNFTTKAMTLHLHQISESLRLLLIERYAEDTSNKCPPLDKKFNHCTVLLYSGTNNNGMSNYSLAFHSDCTFDHNGNYIKHRNSQEENTSVVVLTIGDSRTLFFKKRVAIPGIRGGKKWKITDDEFKSFKLVNNSVFVLDPKDEVPMKRMGDDYVSQYVHGGISIQNSNALSVAFVFRVVCVDREYDPLTSKLIPSVSDLRNGDCFNNEQNILLRQRLEQFRTLELKSYSECFTNFVLSKLKEWMW